MIESRIKSAALEFSRQRGIRPAVLVQEAMQIGAEIALEHAIGKVQHETKLRRRQNRDGIEDGRGFDYPLAEPRNHSKNGKTP